MIARVLALASVISFIPLIGACQSASSNLAFNSRQSAWTSLDKEAQRKAGKELLAQIAEAAKQGKAEFAIPPGDYRFAENGQWSLIHLSKIKNMTLKAEGATFWLEAWKFGLFITECENFVIDGLTIDYDPLPYAQGSITKVNDDKRPGKSFIEFKVDEGFPKLEDLQFDPVLKRKPAAMPTIVFDKEGKTIKYNQWENWMKTEKVAEGVYRVFTQPAAFQHEGRNVLSYYSDYGISEGDKFVVMHRRPDCAVLIHKSNKVECRGVKVYASPGLVFVESGHHEWTGGLVFDGCKIVRRPGTDRLISAVADGFHSAMSKVGPRIENCEASFIGDDFVNVRGAVSVVVESRSKELEACMRSDFEGEFIFAPGITVKAIDGVSGAPKGEAKIAKASKDRAPEILAASKKLKGSLGTLGIDENAVWRLELDAPIDAAPGDYIVYEESVGAGFAIRNNKFSDNTARGLRIQSCDGVIEGNEISRVRGEAMTFSMQLNWLEGAFCRNIMVLDNSIEDCQTSLSLPVYRREMEAFGLDSKRSFPCVFIRSETKLNAKIPMTAVHHQGICFEGNEISGLKGAAIAISNAQDIAVRGNVFKRDPNVSQEIWKDAGLELEAQEGVVVGKASCKGGIEIKGNTLK